MSTDTQAPDDTQSGQLLGWFRSQVPSLIALAIRFAKDRSALDDVIRVLDERIRHDDTYVSVAEALRPSDGGDVAVTILDFLIAEINAGDLADVQKRTEQYLGRHAYYGSYAAVACGLGFDRIVSRVLLSLKPETTLPIPNLVDASVTLEFLRDGSRYHLDGAKRQAVIEVAFAAAERAAELARYRTRMDTEAYLLRRIICTAFAIVGSFWRGEGDEDDLVEVFARLLAFQKPALALSIVDSWVSAMARFSSHADFPAFHLALCRHSVGEEPNDARTILKSAYQTDSLAFGWRDVSRKRPFDEIFVGRMADLKAADPLFALVVSQLGWKGKKGLRELKLFENVRPDAPFLLKMLSSTARGGTFEATREYLEEVLSSFDETEIAGMLSELVGLAEHSPTRFPWLEPITPEGIQRGQSYLEKIVEKATTEAVYIEGTEILLAVRSQSYDSLRRIAQEMDKRFGDGPHSIRFRTLRAVVSRKMEEALRTERC